MENETIKEDLLDHVKDREIKCATISFLNDDYGYDLLSQLNVNYTKDQYNEFLKSLDIEFDSGFGTQNVKGIIWYKDGTWSSRYEYDGSECWGYNVCPEIPLTLI